VTLTVPGSQTAAVPCSFLDSRHEINDATMTFTATKKSPSATTLIVILLIAFYLVVSSDQIALSLWKRALEPRDSSSSSSRRQRWLSFMQDPQTIVQKEIPIDAAVTDDINLFEKYWHSEWKQKLCPNQRPSTREYHKLAQLAKRALNITSNVGPAGSISFNTGEFYPGINRYKYVSTTDNKTRSYDYVTIWKCGNNQIRFWSKKLFQQANPRGVKADCTVTAVRDPISHFLSGYNEIEQRWLAEPSEVGYKDFPILYRQTTGQKLKFTKQEVGSKLRFETFLIDMFDNSATRHWMFSHVYPMSRVLGRYKLTGYLPTIQNLTHDWPRFLGNNCPGMTDLITSSSMEVIGQHNSSNDPHGTYHASKEVWRDQGPFARALCLMHAIDYACWDDLSHGIPLFCQNVYSSPSFAQAMGY